MSKVNILENRNGDFIAQIDITPQQRIEVDAAEHYDYHGEYIVSSPIVVPYSDFINLSLLPIGEHEMELSSALTQRLSSYANLQISSNV